MFINKDSLKITANGQTINLGQYLLEVKYSYNKLWGEDSGRTLSGNMTGSLIGIFPKLECQFRRLKQNELELLAPIFDSAVQSLTYYDPMLGRNNTISTYTGDWGITNRTIGKNDGFSISFIARSKR